MCKGEFMYYKWIFKLVDGGTHSVYFSDEEMKEFEKKYNLKVNW